MNGLSQWTQMIVKEQRMILNHENSFGAVLDLLPNQPEEKSKPIAQIGAHIRPIASSHQHDLQELLTVPRLLGNRR